MANRAGILAALSEVRRRNNGKISKQAVVRAARTPGVVSAASYRVLHAQFDWNLQRAAMRHWLDCAQSLITRYETVVTTVRSRSYTVPVYVRTPTAQAEESSFTLHAEIVTQSDADLLMREELNRCVAIIDRARRVIAGLARNRAHAGLPARFEHELQRIIYPSEGEAEAA